MWIFISLFILALGVIAFRSFHEHILQPLKRAGQHSQALAEGRTSEGYVVQGPEPVKKIIRDLQVIDQRMHERQANAMVEEFSLRTILSSMVEGVIVTDGHGVIQVANQAFVQMFQLSSDPLKRPLLEVLRQVEIKNILDQALVWQKENTGEVDITDLLSEQSRRVFQVSASPLGGAGTELKGAVVVFHDISRIKQLEEIRREFVANVSHELRTPLAIFHGYLETILDQNPGEEEIQRVLKVMKRHSDRLNDLVIDLLTLSRLESGQIKLEPVVLPIAPLLARLKDDWKSLLEKKQCRLVVDCAEGIPAVEVDTLRIEQVFYNLLENALKYSEDGKEILVGALYRDGEDSVDFYVKDYGTGIPSDKIGNIFQRFYRVDRARSRDKGGTGLGLAIVKHIVQLHGGVVWAESCLRYGATTCGQD
jgi:two-component system, OmpR family, phosphate regulon sensor histidine kinase PhoR